MLYHSGQHAAALVPGTIKVLALAIIWVFLFVILSQFGFGSLGIGIVLALITLVSGIRSLRTMERKNTFYVTDRRVVRFEANTPFTARTRSLSWSDAVKTKTYPPNIFWKMINVGTVVIHSQSTFVQGNEPRTGEALSNDDIDLVHTYYYEDLGNYIDKVIYLYKNNASELASLKGFVPKPRGQRD